MFCVLHTAEMAPQLRGELVGQTNRRINTNFKHTKFKSNFLDRQHNVTSREIYLMIMHVLYVEKNDVIIFSERKNSAACIELSGDILIRK